MSKVSMVSKACAWCGRSYEEHGEFPTGARVPCGLLKSGFVTKKPEPEPALEPPADSKWTTREVLLLTLLRQAWGLLEWALNLLPSGRGQARQIISQFVEANSFAKDWERWPTTEELAKANRAPVPDCQLCGRPWPHTHSRSQIDAWKEQGGKEGFDPRSLAEEITKVLFTSGYEGEMADRLVLMKDGVTPKDIGGWDVGAAFRAIKKILERVGVDDPSRPVEPMDEVSIGMLEIAQNRCAVDRSYTDVTPHTGTIDDWGDRAGEAKAKSDPVAGMIARAYVQGVESERARFLGSSFSRLWEIHNLNMVSPYTDVVYCQVAPIGTPPGGEAVVIMGSPVKLLNRLIPGIAKAIEAECSRKLARARESKS